MALGGRNGLAKVWERSVLGAIDLGLPTNGEHPTQHTIAIIVMCNRQVVKRRKRSCSMSKIKRKCFLSWIGRMERVKS